MYTEVVKVRAQGLARLQVALELFEETFAIAAHAEGRRRRARGCNERVALDSLDEAGNSCDRIDHVFRSVPRHYWTPGGTLSAGTTSISLGLQTPKLFHQHMKLDSDAYCSILEDFCADGTALRAVQDAHGGVGLAAGRDAKAGEAVSTVLLSHALCVLDHQVAPHQYRGHFDVSLTTVRATTVVLGSGPCSTQP